MADAGSSIFNKKATEKLRSPDDLDKYVRVTNPSVWVALVACVFLLAGLLAWGAFGTISTSINCPAVNINGETMCFLKPNDASKVHVDDDAIVEGSRMKVSDITAIPKSKDEIRNILGSDYLASSLVNDDWAYVVRFETVEDSNLEQGIPLEAYITTERIPPLSLIIKSKDLN